MSARAAGNMATSPSADKSNLVDNAAYNQPWSLLHDSKTLGNTAAILATSDQQSSTFQSKEVYYTFMLQVINFNFEKDMFN